MTPIYVRAGDGVVEVCVSDDAQDQQAGERLFVCRTLLPDAARRLAERLLVEASQCELTTRDLSEQK